MFCYIIRRSTGTIIRINSTTNNLRVVEGLEKQYNGVVLNIYKVGD